MDHSNLTDYFDLGATILIIWIIIIIVVICHLTRSTPTCVFTLPIYLLRLIYRLLIHFCLPKVLLVYARGLFYSFPSSLNLFVLFVHSMACFGLSCTPFECESNANLMPGKYLSAEVVSPVQTHLVITPASQQHDRRFQLGSNWSSCRVRKRHWKERVEWMNCGRMNTISPSRTRSSGIIW